MRDLVLAALLLGLLPVALARPFVAVCLFTWLSVMNPHRLTYGWTYSFNWAMLYGLVMTVSVLWFHGDRIWQALRHWRMPLLFTAWTVVTTLAAAKLDLSADYLEQFLKLQWSALAALAVIRSRRELAVFTAIVALSVGFFGAKGAPWVLATGGQWRLTGPMESTIADNNHLAVALLTVVPLLYWLAINAQRRWQRLACWGVIAGSLVAAIGTYSRGGLITLMVLGAGFLVLSRRRLAVVLVMIPFAVVALAMMPPKFWERMQTITTYQDDGSAMDRINTWKAYTRLANDHPLGSGFRSYQAPGVFAPYAEPGHNVRAAHSIYFQVLGEHGWIGLALYLSMFASMVWRLARARRAAEDPWLDDLRRLTVLALLCCLAGGAFLSLAYWDGLFYLLVIGEAGLALAHARDAEGATAAAAAPMPARRSIFADAVRS